MATTEERLDALVTAVNELSYAVTALATNDNQEIPPRTNAGRAAYEHIQLAATAMFDAKPD